MMSIQSRKREEPTHSEDPNSRASSSSNAPHGGDHEGEDKWPKGNAYEVFLNFRGIDTRKNFTDYLYTSLTDAGIHVFRDDNELCVGEEIGPELLCNITQSTISIPIISKNYVSSKWCLHELVQMLKCKRSKGQIVLPIFYKVEPSQVRHPIGRWREAIDAHKKNMEEMVVKEWEEALKEVSFLKGWESEKIDNGHEGTLVKIIVKKVMGELKRLFQLNLPKQLVGIEDHVQLMSNMDAEFNGTKIIGIYGMGGIGKTTLAKVLYNKLSSHFDYCSFLANIRETSERNGIECVQKQLIHDITRSSYDVSNVDEGVSFIKSRFMGKKVLVLLDDIDDNTQLNALVGDGSWVEAGSIVIITTRNKSILDEANVGYMYQLNELSLDQSLILFSRHAFRKDSPPSDYEVISSDVVSTTGGLPLALEVIGSFLWRKKKDLWKGTLKKLKKVPHEKVQEKLKISYDALDYREQQIFLDIACLFTRTLKQNPTYMWDACDFFPGMGIEVLSLRSLIETEGNGVFLLMHDQLRDLGREIVYLENPREPQKRSRLWIGQEALDVLDHCKLQGTKKIEALSLGTCGVGRRYTAEQFKELTNLRFLQVDGVDFIGDFQSLLPKLRWLQWNKCPSNFTAANFHLKKLVVLDLSYSAISEDWGGWVPLKMATELKVLNLNNCQSLKRTPDLSTFRRLEILTLINCKNLEELHLSIGNLASLIELDVGYSSITKLPESIENMQNLRILNIYCTNITELPDAIGMLAELQKLVVWKCKNLERLPSNICKLISLKKLNVGVCEKLRELPELPSGLTDLEIGCQGQSLPHLSQLTRLKKLYLRCCHRLEFVPELPIGLSELSVFRCEILKALTNLSDLKHLRSFYIKDCPSLEGSPDVSNFRRTQMRELGWKGMQLYPGDLLFYRE
ncbi:disease resistance protein RUN1-like isoform X2 [Eucalyptus grandis]|uniref:disease resistance protein RUN1-like isoform X2 n=1 Tax=Eucalyptus grandis TaxID=71139 RepID=UPI00192F0153|nr:disease resistance protein RUN1-like isoform X2 [Eucalyptus grandis]